MAFDGGSGGSYSVLSQGGVENGETVLVGRGDFGNVIGAEHLYGVPNGQHPHPDGTGVGTGIRPGAARGYGAGGLPCPQGEGPLGWKLALYCQPGRPIPHGRDRPAVCGNGSVCQGEGGQAFCRLLRPVESFGGQYGRGSPPQLVELFVKLKIEN